MKVRFDKSFVKALERIQDPNLLKRIESVILKAEKASTLSEPTNLKKIKGYTSYYRIKIGDYRLDLETISADEILIITVLHRRKIYRKFP
jgi:mRNA interferase RelE/StbE